jgi:hypothetical protein
MLFLLIFYLEVYSFLILPFSTYQNSEVWTKERYVKLDDIIGDNLEERLYLRYHLNVEKNNRVEIMHIRINLLIFCNQIYLSISFYLFKFSFKILSISSENVTPCLINSS